MYGDEISDEVKKEYFETNLKAAKIGLPESMCEVANLYYIGFGVEKNLDEAIKWLEKAVEFGNISAAKNLAIMDLEGFDSYYGRSVPNVKNSLAWLKKVLEM